jgi:RNA polymerase sigma-70 factor (ECF subfamily)
MIVEFHEIYERHAAAVLRFATGLTGNPTLAQDLTADAFVRLWTASGEIRLETIRAYLFTIVRNLYRSDRRRSWRAAPLDDTIPDPIERVAEPVERRSELAAALRALKEVPVGDREALLMRAGGVSYDDISRALGITVGAAKVRVHRSRARLLRLRDVEEQPWK